MGNPGRPPWFCRLTGLVAKRCFEVVAARRTEMRQRCRATQPKVKDQRLLFCIDSPCCCSWWIYEEGWRKGRCPWSNARCTSCCCTSTTQENKPRTARNDQNCFPFFFVYSSKKVESNKSWKHLYLSFALGIPRYYSFSSFTRINTLANRAARMLWFVLCEIQSVPDQY